MSGLQASTHWSRLVAPDERDAAFGYFYRTYSGALNDLFSAKGVPPSEVDDLVQEFFADALQRQFLERADPTRGRFRSYLKTFASRFLVDYWRRSGRQKRQPAQGLQRLDEERVAGRDLSPDEQFDLAWARSIFRQSLQQAKLELRQKGRDEQFQVFTARQAGEAWRDLALRFQTTEATVRGWGTSAKKVVARCLRREIACTVSGEPDLEEELAYLADLLAKAKDSPSW